MIKPLISIVVPVYNSERWIEKCIESILNQTYMNYELIAVDDGSKDASLKKLTELSVKDSRIRVYHKENSGVSATRNYGMSLARGEWITFVDSDDSLKPLFLEKLLPMKDNVEMTVCGAEIIQKRRVTDCFFVQNRCVKDGVYHIARVYNCLRNQVFNGPVRKLFKKSIIVDNNLKFPLDKSYGEDVDFVYSYLHFVNEIQISSYNGYQINMVNDNSLSSIVDAKTHYTTVMHNYNLYIDFLREKGVTDRDYVESYYDHNMYQVTSMSYWRPGSLNCNARIEIYKELFRRKAWKRMKLPFYFCFLGKMKLWLGIDLLRKIYFSVAFIKKMICK